MLRSWLVSLLALSCSHVLAQVGPAPAPVQEALAEQRVMGSVTDQGKPVAGAEVILAWRKYPLDDGQSALAMTLVTRTVQTAADGGFEAMVPPWRWFSVWARHGQRASKVLMEQRSPTPSLSLELAEATRVSGSLRHGGQPVPGRTKFRLVLISSSKHLVPLQATGETDESGSFQVDGLPAESSWLLQLEPGQWRLSRPTVLEPGKSVEVAVDRPMELTCAFALPTGGAATGGVRGDVLHLAQTGSFEADASGQATLRGLAAGAGATLLLRPKGFATQIVPLEPGLSPHAPAPQATLTLRAGRAVKGRVVDGKGQPAAGLEVLFVGTIHMTGIQVNDVSVLVTTDANGEYSTTELDPDALYVPTAILPSGEAQEMALMDPRKPEPDLGTFKLGGRRASITVQLVELPPMQRFELRLYGPRSMGNMRDWRPLARTADGTWLTPNVLEGEYCLLAVSQGVGFGRLALTMPATSTAPMTGRIVLARQREISGTVLTGNGQPAEGQMVMLVPHGGTEDGGSPNWTDFLSRFVMDDMFPEDKHPRKAVTGKDGKFKLICYEGSGDYDLLVRTEKFDRAPPEPVRVEHVLLQTGEIQITAR